VETEQKRPKSNAGFFSHEENDTKREAEINRRGTTMDADGRRGKFSRKKAQGTQKKESE
jgi:hypothetical protein